MLDYQNGTLCWVDRPAPEMTKEQLIAIAEGKRKSLIDRQCSQSVNPVEVAGGRKLTGRDGKNNCTLDYRMIRQ
jgi:hypothetical protein